MNSYSTPEHVKKKLEELKLKVVRVIESEFDHSKVLAKDTITNEIFLVVITSIVKQGQKSGVPHQIIRENIGTHRQLSLLLSKQFYLMNILSYNISDDLTIVVKRLEGGRPLYDFMYNQELSKLLTYKNMKIILYKILCALSFFHDHELIHNKICPQNIYLILRNTIGKSGVKIDVRFEDAVLSREFIGLDYGPHCKYQMPKLAGMNLSAHTRMMFGFARDKVMDYPPNYLEELQPYKMNDIYAVGVLTIEMICAYERTTLSYLQRDVDKKLLQIEELFIKSQSFPFISFINRCISDITGKAKDPAIKLINHEIFREINSRLSGRARAASSLPTKGYVDLGRLINH